MDGETIPSSDLRVAAQAAIAHASRMHRVAVVAVDDLVPLDLAIASDTLSLVRLRDGRPGYRVRVCGVRSQVDTGAFQLRVRYGLAELANADTIVVPGVRDLSRPVPAPLICALRAAAARGARIVSICTGAFVLAASGLLDGRRATTHWLAADELKRRYPKVRVDPNVLYVDEGQVLTSAGAAAGIDLCVHIVRLDYGPAAAETVARLSVMPLERAASFPQTVVRADPGPDGVSLSQLLSWLAENLHSDLTLGVIARRASMSVRSLSRRFQEQTGTSPMRWLIQARVRRAQLLLETTAHSMESVAQQVGFSSAAALRQHFRRATAKSPHAYRRSLGRLHPEAPAQVAARP